MSVLSAESAATDPSHLVSNVQREAWLVVVLGLAGPLWTALPLEERRQRRASERMD